MKGELCVCFQASCLSFYLHIAVFKIILLLNILHCAVINWLDLLRTLADHNNSRFLLGCVLGVFFLTIYFQSRSSNEWNDFWRLEPYSLGITYIPDMYATFWWRNVTEWGEVTEVSSWEQFKKNDTLIK